MSPERSCQVDGCGACLIVGIMVIIAIASFIGGLVSFVDWLGMVI